MTPLPLRVVHWINSLDPVYGGPSRSVPALDAALRAAGAVSEISVWTEGTRNGARRVPDDVVIHDHGLWLKSNHTAATMARRRGLPLVVSPRGMLEPWALAHRTWKKRLAWLLYQRRDLNSASAIHVTSRGEAESVRGLGIGRPIAVIPNGVAIPPDGESSSSARSHGPVPGLRRALFLSRIHPKKGLPMLLEAWAGVRPEGWELVIAGPGPPADLQELTTSIRNLGLGESVRVLGSIDDVDKWDLYRSADLFVLPTHSENFGLVVAEALASRVPVITTRGAPWSALETAECGWWIDIGTEPLLVALRQATGISDEIRDAMGRRGRALIERDYAWPQIAEEWLALYAWVVGGGPPPECLWDPR